MKFLLIFFVGLIIGWFQIKLFFPWLLPAYLAVLGWNRVRIKPWQPFLWGFFYNFLIGRSLGLWSLILILELMVFQSIKYEQ